MKKKLIKQHGASRVFNADETAVYRVAQVYSCIGTIGAESVKIVAGANEKECWTFMPIVAADGTKLKTVVCKKGKTKRTLKAMQLPINCIPHFNDSGFRMVR